jgi:glucosamine-phosphate N-acetyltransferase
LKDNILIYVLSDDDKNEIIACGTLIIEPKFIHDCSKLAHIEDIVVSQKYRGMGKGKSMIDHLVMIAKQMGCYKVRLVCSEENAGFYAKCNFEKNGVEMIQRLQNY